MTKKSLIWEKEVIYLSGDDYFNAVESAVNKAKSSIKLQVYIFSHDAIGEKFIRLLSEAARRKVNVKIIVDGIGSWGWSKYFGNQVSETGIKVKIYHKLPWDGVLSKISLKTEQLSALQSLLQINRRAHGKLILIDDTIAFVGSRNVCAMHSENLSGTDAWYDISAELHGRGIEDLVFAFDYLWMTRQERSKLQFRSFLRKNDSSGANVRLNIFWKQRRNNYKRLCKMITDSKSRVWIICSYFLPSASLLRALRTASFNGVDIKILVPATSDVFFFPWITCGFYSSLLKSDVKIYEYMKSMLHAKSIIIDDLAIVGSSNLNHRSLLHDFEVDVVISRPESIAVLSDSYIKALTVSRQITKTSCSSYPFYQRLLGQFALLFKNFL